MRRVALIIVHYRTVADTIQCLESALRLELPEDVRASIVVVDNASEDGSWDRLVEWRRKREVLWTREYSRAEIGVGVAEASTHCTSDPPSEITFLRASKNGGYAAGANLGVRFALKETSTTDFWILNNDTVLLPDSLEKMIARSHQDRRSIYGPTLLYHDDLSRVQAAGGAVYLPALGRSRHVGKGGLIGSLGASVELDYIVGAALFIPREVFAEIGLLPEQFYLYFEETEFCARARSCGITLQWVRDSRIVHKEGKSTGTGGGFRQVSDLAFRYIVRNSLLYTESRYPFWLMFVCLFNLLDCLRHCCCGDIGKVRVFCLAFQEYWRVRPRIAREAAAIGD